MKKDPKEKEKKDEEKEKEIERNDKEIELEEQTSDSENEEKETKGKKSNNTEEDNINLIPLENQENNEIKKSFFFELIEKIKKIINWKEISVMIEKTWHFALLVSLSLALTLSVFPGLTIQLESSILQKASWYVNLKEKIF